MEPIETVAAGYDRLAAKWDEWTGTVVPDLRRDYVRQLTEDISPGARVLELGCGTGRPVAAMLAEAHDYRGVDVSPEMIRVAQANLPEARFESGDMATLRFPPDSFAAVVAFYSIIHLPRIHHASLFASIHRWLTPGGWFVANLGTSNLEGSVEEDWLGSVDMYWSGFDCDENLSMLEAAGFSIVDAQVRQQMEGDQPVEFLWARCQPSQ